MTGPHLTAIPGEDCKAKHAAAANMSKAEWEKLVAKNGYATKVTEGAVAVFPPLYLLIILDTSETEAADGVVWKLLGSDAVLADSDALLQNMLTDMPELKHGSHGLLHDYLQNRVATVATSNIEKGKGGKQ